MMRLGTLRAAMVIGRRDFTATVMSKTFLLFLLGPLLPIVVGVLFGGIGANVASEAERPTVAVLANADAFAALSAARDRIDVGLRGAPVLRLVRENPEADTKAQARRLLAGDRPLIAVLSGPLEQPSVTGQVREGDAVVTQLSLILVQARQGAKPPPPMRFDTVSQSSGSTAAARALTAHAGQALLFVLTLLLAGMLLSQLIEEKSNKVIEVLAAAVPVDAIFLGKLFAMLAMSMIGIAVWASAAVIAVTAFAPPGTLSLLPPPALGWPGFGLLALVYFAFGYLLIGAAFLGIGAQASTVREVQTLSMPITMSQLVIFALAATAAVDPNSTGGIAAAIVPLSSPYAMLARAALDDRWWPHLLAILWQIAWLALILRLAAAFFRRSVLKSGSGRGLFRRKRSPA